MKTLKTAALVLGICLILLPQAHAEGFFDLYGGFSKFSDIDATDSYTNPGSKLEHNAEFPSSKVLDSFAAGFRVGGTTKMERVNFSLAYDNAFYNVAAIPKGNTGLLANKDASAAYYQDAQGGFVWQPGVEFLVGVPLRYFRAYAGYGLVFPFMFYNYTARDPDTGLLTPNQMGMSGAVGGHFLFGGRWLITKRLNLMIEDRIQSLYTPLVIKNSAYDPVNKVYYNRSFTFKDLPANQLLVGIGFAWGD